MNRYLDLSTGAVHPMRYGKIIAETTEQLLAYEPEFPWVWGFVQGQRIRRMHNGTEWKHIGLISIDSTTTPVVNGAYGIDQYAVIWEGVNDAWVFVSGAPLIDPTTTPIVAGLVGVFEGDVYLSYDDSNSNYYWNEIGEPLPTILADLNSVTLADINGNLLIL